MIAQLDNEYLKTGYKNIIQRLISYLFFEGRPLTTKGRFINPLVFSLLNRLKKLSGNIPRNYKPIFIVGIGRSGTTILGKILSSHQSVGYLNEPKAIWYSIFGNEDINGNYTQGPCKIELDSDDVNEKDIMEMNSIYGSYLKLIGADRVVDKYPALIYRIPFVLSVFPEARFIFLVRDGRDNLLSITQWSEQKGWTIDDNLEDWWGVNNRKWNLLLDQLVDKKKEWNSIKDKVREYRNHVDMSAVEWILSMQAGLNAEKKFPDSIIRIRYEGLVKNPEKYLAQICDFTDLKFDRTMNEYAISVLGKLPQKKEPKIATELQPLFYKTMQKLGYTS